MTQKIDSMFHVPQLYGSLTLTVVCMITNIFLVESSKKCYMFFSFFKIMIIKIDKLLRTDNYWSKKMNKLYFYSDSFIYDIHIWHSYMTFIYDIHIWHSLKIQNTFSSSFSIIQWFFNNLLLLAVVFKFAVVEMCSCRNLLMLLMFDNVVYILLLLP